MDEKLGSPTSTGELRAVPGSGGETRRDDESDDGPAVVGAGVRRTWC